MFRTSYLSRVTFFAVGLCLALLSSTAMAMSAFPDTPRSHASDLFASSVEVSVSLARTTEFVVLASQAIAVDSRLKRSHPDHDAFMRAQALRMAVLTLRDEEYGKRQRWNFASVREAALPQLHALNT